MGGNRDDRDDVDDIFSTHNFIVITVTIGTFTTGTVKNPEKSFSVASFRFKVHTLIFKFISVLVH